MADVVARKLGDTRAIVLSNYIDPVVFAKWAESANLQDATTRPKISAKSAEARGEAGQLRAPYEAYERALRDRLLPSWAAPGSRGNGRRGVDSSPTGETLDNRFDAESDSIRQAEAEIDSTPRQEINERYNTSALKELGMPAATGGLARPSHERGSLPAVARHGCQRAPMRRMRFVAWSNSLLERQGLIRISQPLSSDGNPRPRYWTRTTTPFFSSQAERVTTLEPGAWEKMPCIM